jgi:nicotinamide mononucleotide transporter
VAWFEWTAAVITAISVYLQARQNIWNWPTAIVSVVMYMVVYARSGLYSDAGLQGYFLATSIYGWYHWRHGGQGDTTLPVSRASKRVWLWCVVLGASFWITAASITSRMDGVSYPWVDAGTTTISLIAQWMVTRKLLESWLLWIVVNVVYIPMLLMKELYPTALLYSVLLVLAIKGFVDWRRSYRAWVREPAGMAEDPSLRPG